MDMPANVLTWPAGIQHLALQCKHGRPGWFRWSDYAGLSGSPRHLATEIIVRLLRHGGRGSRNVRSTRDQLHHNQVSSRIDFEADWAAIDRAVGLTSAGGGGASVQQRSTGRHTVQRTGNAAGLRTHWHGTRRTAGDQTQISAVQERLVGLGLLESPPYPNGEMDETTQQAIAQFETTHAAQIDEIREAQSAMDEHTLAHAPARGERPSDMRSTEGRAYNRHPQTRIERRQAREREAEQAGAFAANSASHQALVNTWPRPFYGAVREEAAAYQVIVRTVRSRGLPIDESKVNIVGVRGGQGGAVIDNSPAASRTTRYDDCFLMVWRDERSQVHVREFRGTTEPGRFAGESQARADRLGSMETDQQLPYHFSMRNNTKEHRPTLAPVTHVGGEGTVVHPGRAAGDAREVMNTYDADQTRRHPESLTRPRDSGRPDEHYETRDHQRMRVVGSGGQRDQDWGIAMHSGGVGESRGDTVGGDSQACQVVHGEWYGFYIQTLRGALTSVGWQPDDMETDASGLANSGYVIYSLIDVQHLTENHTDNRQAQASSPQAAARVQRRVVQRQPEPSANETTDSPRSQGPTNRLMDGAVIVDDESLWSEAEAQAQRDKDHLLAVLSGFLTAHDATASAHPQGTGLEQIQHEAAVNAARKAVENPDFIQVMTPMWNGSFQSDSAGWYAVSDGTRRQDSQKDKGAYYPSSGRLIVRVSTQAFADASGWTFSPFPANDLIAIVCHETQHHFDREAYPDTNVGTEEDLVRFKREFRGRILTGQHPSPLPRPPSELGLEDSTTNAVFVYVLDYPRRDHPAESLYDLYQRDAEFKAACDAFRESFVTESLNLTNSQAIDDLHQFIARHFDGVQMAWDDEGPWNEVEQLVARLTPPERARLRDNEAWRQFIDQTMLDEQATRFWQLLP